MRPILFFPICQTTGELRLNWISHIFTVGIWRPLKGIFLYNKACGESAGSGIAYRG